MHTIHYNDIESKKLQIVKIDYLLLILRNHNKNLTMDSSSTVVVFRNSWFHAKTNNYEWKYIEKDLRKSLTIQ